MTRVRISPTQLRMIALAAASGWGVDKEIIYRDLHGIPFRFQRGGSAERRIPDAIKASVHRSLSRLAAGGFLQYVPHRSHDGKTWVLTMAGKALADKHGFPVADAEAAARAARLQLKARKGGQGVVAALYGDRSAP